ncbi:hypothetical protein Bbelb_225510 [Branchiostoma belcheri]|nr:hypothetical protein Bbelb_225510 [Branchiostoma belcheri]
MMGEITTTQVSIVRRSPGEQQLNNSFPGQCAAAKLTACGWDKIDRMTGGQRSQNLAWSQQELEVDMVDFRKPRIAYLSNLNSWDYHVVMGDFHPSQLVWTGHKIILINGCACTFLSSIPISNFPWCCKRSLPIKGKTNLF